MTYVRSDIEKHYFEWMFDLVCSGRYNKRVSFRMLLEYLHDVNFTYKLSRDANRAENGIDLRYQFAYETGQVGAERYIEGPCSVLEMMVALSIRCEEIMDDPAYGDRTAQWFWKMVVNLGLGGMTDDRYDEYYIEEVIQRFLNREYEPDGKGGLFRVKNCPYDLRREELWYQMCWAMDEIT